MVNSLQHWLAARIVAYQERGGGIGRFRVDCNFEPTCSEYARQAVLRFGVLRGLGLALGRIRRCTDRDCVHRRADPVPGPEGQD
jgi:putative component of membrane protein insertase Oxa1/YidC/SpoIIIJ protein YidD